MMIQGPRMPLRTPAERVGLLPNADTPPPETTPGPDEVLLARALRDRDEHAFRRVFERLLSPMLRLARVYVRTSDEAEDVVQETWLAALRGAGSFRGRASFRTWLFQILRNRARTRGKRGARLLPFSQVLRSEGADGGEAGVPDEAWGTGPADVDWAHPEQELLAGELRGKIEAAMEQLPPRQREVMALRDIEGWSSEEVRATLDLSQENQRVLLHRARARVRQLLGPYLHGDAELDRPLARIA